MLPDVSASEFRVVAVVAGGLDIVAVGVGVLLRWRFGLWLVGGGCAYFGVVGAVDVVGGVDDGDGDGVLPLFFFGVLLLLLLLSCRVCCSCCCEQKLWFDTVAAIVGSMALLLAMLLSKFLLLFAAALGI